MRELIISNYDCSTHFHACVIENNIVINSMSHPKELLEYDLYDLEHYIFDRKNLNPSNEKLLQFDRIIYCEDGNIELYTFELYYRKVGENA